MRGLVLMLLALVAGCGNYQPDAEIARQGCGWEKSNNHGCGFEYDVQGASGMNLRYTPMVDASSLLADVSSYEDVFAAIQISTGISAPPPFVILVAFGTLPLSDRGLPAGGNYLSAPSLIRIVSDPPLVTSIPLDELVGMVFCHEAVHYLLDYSTGNPDPQHHSLLFSSCGI
jgi:hypothetical protein